MKKLLIIFIQWNSLLNIFFVSGFAILIFKNHMSSTDIILWFLLVIFCTTTCCGIYYIVCLISFNNSCYFDRNIIQIITR